MNHLFAVADYAINYAVDMAMDAKMKGPRQCDEFYEKMEEAVRLMIEAQTAMHLFNGGAGELPVERIDTEGKTWVVRVSIGRDTYILTEEEATALAAKLDAALGVEE